MRRNILDERKLFIYFLEEEAIDWCVFSKYFFSSDHNPPLKMNSFLNSEFRKSNKLTLTAWEE